MVEITMTGVLRSGSRKKVVESLDGGVARRDHVAGWAWELRPSIHV